MVEIDKLQPGVRYVFHTKPWEHPDGGTLPGKAKARRYVRRMDIGPVGMTTIPFLEVSRDNGSLHLIAIERIERIEPAVSG